MKIAILGAGALGCYYGARLQKSGHDVSFIVRSEYDYLKEHGLEVKSLHGNISLPRHQGIPGSVGSRSGGSRRRRLEKHGQCGICQGPPSLDGTRHGGRHSPEWHGKRGGNRPYYPVGPHLRGPVLHLRHAGGTGPHQPFGRRQHSIRTVRPVAGGLRQRRRNFPLSLPGRASRHAPLTTRNRSSGTSSSGTYRSTGSAWRWGASASRNSTKTRKTSPVSAASWKKWSGPPKPAATRCRTTWSNSTFPARKAWEPSSRPAPWTTTKDAPSNTRPSGGEPLGLKPTAGASVPEWEQLDRDIRQRLKMD